MRASTIYLNLIYLQASIGEYLEGMSILHINECKELLRSTHGSISILAATADAVIYLRFLLSEQNLLTGTYYLGYAVQIWLGNLHMSCHFFCNCRMNTSQSIHQSLYKQSFFQVNKGSSPRKAESQQVSILAMQWFVSNLYDLHIKIKSVLWLKWKPYSAGIHCEGEPAQGVRALCIRVTWLSVEVTGCCSTSLLSVGQEKKKKNLPHYAFPPRSKVSFHPSLPDGAQHMHPPKKEQRKLRQWNWMSTGWRTGSVFIGYSSKNIYPSRQTSQEGLVLLEMSQYGMTKSQIKP